MVAQHRQSEGVCLPGLYFGLCPHPRHSEDSQAEPAARLWRAPSRRECKKSFGSHVARPGQAGSAARSHARMAKELTKSTFVPAVRKAVLKPFAKNRNWPRRPRPSNRRQRLRRQPASQQALVQRFVIRQPAKPAPAGYRQQPISVEAELELAKEEMFSCYRDARPTGLRRSPTSRLMPQWTMFFWSAAAIHGPFSNACSPIYPHSPSAQAERMRAAISNNYRPAIEKRVTAIRSAGTSVQKQKVTSTAQ